MASAKVALRPENEATRPSGKGRATTNYINIISADDNSIEALRAQHLLSRFGLSPAFASIVSPLHFGEARV